jgi:mannose-1-phosphate guanylyltransferase / phosphomannomutase
MKIVILAGGKGTRMGKLAANIPKPMVLLAGKPILQYQVENAKVYGYDDIIMLTGYKEEVIKNYFGDGRAFGVNIEYVTDEHPLGTAGAVKELEEKLEEAFIVFYGDTMMDINLNNLVKYHHSKKGLATLVVHPNDHPHDSDLVEIDTNNRVKKFLSKPHTSSQYHQNLVNAALYVLDPQIFRHIEKNKFADFGRDVFPELIDSGEPVYVLNTTEYIKDIGTIDRLGEVEVDYVSGKVQRMNTTFKQKAIFLDRDGVINQEAEPIDSAGKFKLLAGVEDALKRINKSDYLSVVVTNQPMIAKGFANEAQLQEVHNYMETILGQNGIYLDRIYYCPHHPEKGHVGERVDLKVPCSCRKPETGMLDLAALEMNIDLNQSFIVGDRTVDIMTGKHAGVNTILVREGYAGLDGKYECEPDYVFDDLAEAVNFITQIDKTNPDK